MGRVRDWIACYSISRKYGIIWNPFVSLKRGEFEQIYSLDFNNKNSTYTIRVNPFYPNFKSTFLHEVGHCLRYKRAYMKATTEKEFDDAVDDILKEEWIAWKYTKRVMKGSFNSRWAKDCFKSYFPGYIKSQGIEKATRVFHKYDKYLGG